MVLGVVIFVSVVAAAAAIGVSSSGVLAPRHDITETFELRTDTFAPASCEGSGGYSDIQPGTNVTLKDGDGKLLGTSSLVGGKGSGTRCSFTFTFRSIGEVPFYVVEVSHRGELSYSLADMKTAAWTFSLTLGGD